MHVIMSFAVLLLLVAALVHAGQDVSAELLSLGALPTPAWKFVIDWTNVVSRQSAPGLLAPL